MQCALEELNCKESELEVRSFSNELTSWFVEKDSINWENRFNINHLRNIRSWFQNVSITLYKKSELLWLKDWLDKASSSGERQLMHYPIL